MPTTAQRGRAPIGPGNVTGKIFADQLREKQDRDASKDLDIAAIRRTAFLEGHSAGWDAAIAWVIETYGLDADEDQADAEAAQ